MVLQDPEGPFSDFLQRLTKVMQIGVEDSKAI